MGECIITRRGINTSDATATPNDMLAGKSAYTDEGLITGNIPSKSATTITPTTTDQIISSGQYLSGVQTIKGDANLISSNILTGKSIFGVSGALTPGKKFASGTGTSSSTSVGFTTLSGTIVSQYHISVSSLNFTPSFIFIKGTNSSTEWSTVYDANGLMYPKHAKTFMTDSYTASYFTYSIKGDAAPCGVSPTGFTMPVGSANLTCTWYAFE